MHWTVAVRIPGDVPIEKVSDAVEEVLGPYNEDTESAREAGAEIEFDDKALEYGPRWENEEDEFVELPGGQLVGRYSKEADTLAKKLEAAATAAGTTFDSKTILKKVPIRQVFPTLDEYLEYMGYEKDDQTGKYGYWTNFKGYWDWFQIGGRWAGLLDLRKGKQVQAEVPTRKPTAEFMPDPEKTTVAHIHDAPERGVGERSLLDNSGPIGEHEADFARLKDLDWSNARVQMAARAEKFWIDWEQLIAGTYDARKDEFMGGPRSKALDLGLLECLEPDKVPPDAWKTKEVFTKDHETGVDTLWRIDVYHQITKERFLAEHLEAFFPFTTYAFLDKEGGWRNSETKTYRKLEAPANYSKDFLTWLEGGNQEDWLVVVDCHS
jgi:hypothetical protein